MSEYDCDVAIVGGGPVGLCLGFLLGQANVRVRLFEAEAAPAEDLRASTFHPPTLDMLAPFGIAQALVAQGLVCPSWQIRSHPDGARAIFDLSVLADDTAHPFRLQCEQWKLSRLLRDRLTDLATVRTHFGDAVTDLVQDAHGVTVRCLRDGQRHRARFAVGADGARSFVRGALMQAFEGTTYPETTLLVTTDFPFEEHLEGLSNVSYCWKDGGNFSLLRVPGRWRVSLYPREDESIDAQLSDAAIEAALQEIVPCAARYRVIEKRPYRVHQRIAARYVQGRVMLIGDAAHINSPAGGMGLNGGLHDAFELAAALTEILHGGAGLDRLSLFERRRRPVAAEQILAQSDRNRARMREKDPLRRRDLLSDLQAVTRDPVRLRAHLLKSSMIEGLRQAARVT